MTNMRLSLPAILMLGSLLTAGPLLAQPAPPILHQPAPDSPIGSRNPQAPSETAQLDFLIGDWDVAMTLHRSNGEDLNYSARWHNIWIAGGYAVMQEWRGPYATGIELRSFNAQNDSWEGRNFYSFNQAWVDATAEMVDGEFFVETQGADANGPFINRERYYDIGADSFKMLAMRSRDGGLTWSGPTYEMVCTRLD